MDVECTPKEDSPSECHKFDAQTLVLGDSLKDWIQILLSDRGFKRFFEGEEVSL